MKVTKRRVILLTIASLVISVLSYSTRWNLMGKADILSVHLQDSSSQEEEASSSEDELERVLERASMGNKTVIFSVVNKAYTNRSGLLDLFLKSVRTGENTSGYLKHLVLIAVDQKSYDVCKIKHPHCYNLNPDAETFSKELLFMSTGYLNMLWRKTFFLIRVLKLGYSFLFTDVDLVWLRDPFQKLNQGGGDDLQFSCDGYSGYPYGERNAANIGFYFVVSNNKTIALYESLYASRNNTKGLIQQHMLMDMKMKGAFYELGLKVRYLDVAHYGGVCSNGGNFTHMRTMHANCCRGIKNKLSYLSLILDEWQGYKNGSLTHFQWPKNDVCAKSWGQKLRR